MKSLALLGSRLTRCSSILALDTSCCTETENDADRPDHGPDPDQGLLPDAEARDKPGQQPPGREGVLEEEHGTEHPADRAWKGLGVRWYWKGT